MAAKLTHAMLSDLHKGCAAISVLPYDSTNNYAEVGVTFSQLDFSEADKIFTVKDSFNLSPSDPTTEEVKIDQNDETIDTTVEQGEWNMTGNIPSVDLDLLSFFFKEGVAVTGVKGSDGKTYSGKSFFTTPKEVLCAVMVESASQKTAIIFSKVKFIVGGVTQDDATNPAYVAFTGNILANPKEGQGDWSVVNATETA